MSPLWLLLIVPVASSVGFMFGAWWVGAHTKRYAVITYRLQAAGTPSADGAANGGLSRADRETLREIGIDL